MIIDCIADLHGFYPKLEGGDLLIVAGDLTANDSPLQLYNFTEWLKLQPYKKKICIAGNHDNLLFNSKAFKGPESPLYFDYLCDSGTEFEGLKIWGSPWTKTFEGMNPHCKAFTVDTEDELMDKWEMIPEKVDILITHSPPYGILDGIDDSHDGTLFHVGSKTLYGWLQYVERPKLHVFGHIHEGYGQGEWFVGYNDIPVISVNASHVNEYYQPVNKPIRIEL